MWSFVLALGVVATAGSEGQAPAQGVQRLAWLQGCWEGVSADATVEEQWMAPRGGSMIGSGRTVRGDKLVEYEWIVVRERGDALVYEAHPSGQSPAEFVSTSVSDAGVVFENPEHDFPQRIGYRRDGGSLQAWVEGSKGGRTRRIEFPYRRTACAVADIGSGAPQRASGAPATGASARAAVEAATGAFHQALRTNDVETFLSYVADDVVLMPPGETAVRGKSALRAWYTGFLSQYRTSSLTLAGREVFVGEGWAVELGTFEWGLTPTAGGATVLDRGGYMQVWRAQPDGQWRFVREVWNSSAPAPSPAAE